MLVYHLYTVYHLSHYFIRWRQQTEDQDEQARFRHKSGSWHQA
jgi:hypothetical protein